MFINRLIATGIVLFSVAACSVAAPSGESASAAPVATRSSTSSSVTTATTFTQVDAPALGAAIQSPTSTAITSELTEDEITGLQYMREEEKLARDVYRVLASRWQLSTFTKIANSEQTHMDALKSLLDRYGLRDPAADMAAGEFQDASLQKLYEQLITQGSRSMADALKVGASIEELDIVDLQKQTALTSHADIQRVYQNLEKGSRNHLRAFTSRLQS